MALTKKMKADYESKRALADKYAVSASTMNFTCTEEIEEHKVTLTLIFTISPNNRMELLKSCVMGNLDNMLRGIQGDKKPKRLPLPPKTETYGKE